jgi:hypothetical protein
MSRRGSSFGCAERDVCGSSLHQGYGPAYELVENNRCHGEPQCSKGDLVTARIGLCSTPPFVCGDPSPNRAPDEIQSYDSRDERRCLKHTVRQFFYKPFDHVMLWRRSACLVPLQQVSIALHVRSRTPISKARFRTDGLSTFRGMIPKICCTAASGVMRSRKMGPSSRGCTIATL